MKAEFSERIEALAVFDELYRDSGQFDEFFTKHNIGVPIAYALHNGLVSYVTEDGAKWVNDSYEALANLLADTGEPERYIEEIANSLF